MAERTDAALVMGSMSDHNDGVVGGVLMIAIGDGGVAGAVPVRDAGVLLLAETPPAVTL